MKNEEKKVLNWFKKEMSKVSSFNEALENLIKYRDQASQKEKEIYETFCYMDDEDWFEIREELKKL